MRRARLVRYPELLFEIHSTDDIPKLEALNGSILQLRETLGEEEILGNAICAMLEIAIMSRTVKKKAQAQGEKVQSNYRAAIAAQKAGDSVFSKLAENNNQSVFTSAQDESVSNDHFIHQINLCLGLLMQEMPLDLEPIVRKLALYINILVIETQLNNPAYSIEDVLDRCWEVQNLNIVLIENASVIPNSDFGKSIKEYLQALSSGRVEASAYMKENLSSCSNPLGYELALLDREFSLILNRCLRKCRFSKMPKQAKQFALLMNRRCFVQYDKALSEAVLEYQGQDEQDDLDPNVDLMLLRSRYRELKTQLDSLNVYQTTFNLGVSLNYYGMRKVPSLSKRVLGKLLDFKYLQYDIYFFKEKVFQKKLLGELACREEFEGEMCQLEMAINASFTYYRFQVMRAHSFPNLTTPTDSASELMQFFLDSDENKIVHEMDRDAMMTMMLRSIKTTLEDCKLGKTNRGVQEIIDYNTRVFKKFANSYPDGEREDTYAVFVLVMVVLLWMDDFEDEAKTVYEALGYKVQSVMAQFFDGVAKFYVNNVNNTKLVGSNLCKGHVLLESYIRGEIKKSDSSIMMYVAEFFFMQLAEYVNLPNASARINNQSVQAFGKVFKFCEKLSEEKVKKEQAPKENLSRDEPPPRKNVQRKKKKKKKKKKRARKKESKPEDHNDQLRSEDTLLKERGPLKPDEAIEKKGFGGALDYFRGLEKRAKNADEKAEALLNICHCCYINYVKKPSKARGKRFRKASETVIDYIMRNRDFIRGKESYYNSVLMNAEELRILLFARRDFNLKIPDENAQRLINYFASILERDGKFRPYIFGGLLRDAYYNHSHQKALQPNDVDVVCDASIEDLRNILMLSKHELGIVDIVEIGKDTIYYLKVIFENGAVEISSLRQNRDRPVTIDLFLRLFHTNFSMNRLVFSPTERILYDLTRSCEAIEEGKFIFEDKYNQEILTRRPENLFLAMSLLAKYRQAKEPLEFVGKEQFQTRLATLPKLEESQRRQMHNAFLKLFCRGYALASFLTCRRYSSFVVLFPQLTTMNKEREAHIKKSCAQADSVFSSDSRLVDLKYSYKVSFMLAMFFHAMNINIYGDQFTNFLGQSLFWTNLSTANHIRTIHGIAGRDKEHKPKEKIFYAATDWLRLKLENTNAPKNGKSKRPREVILFTKSLKVIGHSHSAE